MNQPSVILLATMDTKEQEAGILLSEMRNLNIMVDILDISLGSKNNVLTGTEKIESMNRVAAERAKDLESLLQQGARVVIGLGGGTGSQIILKMFKRMAMNFPKVLVTTLPFDPRDAVSDNSIIIVPTLCDVQGMNYMLRDLFRRVAALVSGLVLDGPRTLQNKENNAVAITALGITNRGVVNVQKRIEETQLDTVIFHSNGYGGAALVRAIDEKIVDGLIDFTPHELTRLRIAGANVEMPRRFTACVENNLPMVFAPGGLNFIGLGSFDELEDKFKKRPTFRHSELFTHVGVLPEEMVIQTEYLMDCLNRAKSTVHLLVPMRGFSDTDRKDRELYSPELRQVFLDTAKQLSGPNISVTEFPELHIEDAEFADICSNCLLDYLNQD